MSLASRVAAGLTRLANEVKALQSDLNDKVPGTMQIGTHTATISSGGTGQVPVTFNQPYATVPKVFTTSVNWNFVASVSDITTTGFSLNFRRINGTSTTPQPGDWLAIGPLA